MDSVLGLQVVTAVLVNGAFAWLVGSWLARRWLAKADGSLVQAEGILRPLDILAATIGVIGVGAAMWATTAVMGGVSLLEAKDLFWQMLTSTSIGRAGYISLAAISIALIFRTLRTTSAWREWTVLAALAVFAFIRASMGHAGENGYWTAAFAAEFVHLSAMGVWTGLVAVSGWKVISSSSLSLEASSVTKYLESMSTAALAAVMAIFATGFFNAWHRVGSVDALFSDNLYSYALLTKLALVCIGLLLGGYNKFIGLPRAQHAAHGVERVKLVLTVESFILTLVLVAAAVLTSQQPPSAM
jgi:putative copper resistance protein D